MSHIYKLTFSLEPSCLLFLKEAMNKGINILFCRTGSLEYKIKICLRKRVSLLLVHHNTNI